jgi:hypothetical protein
MSVFEEATQGSQGEMIDLSAADWVPTAPCRVLLVGLAGNIVGRQVHDTADVTYPVPAGYNPLRFKIIRKTGTTATGLVAIR